MKGKAPQTILTDQNVWLKEAIAIEMSATKHALCIWHISMKFSDWFSVLLGSQYDDWKAEFLRLYNLDLVEDFEQERRQYFDNAAVLVGGITHHFDKYFQQQTNFILFFIRVNISVQNSFFFLIPSLFTFSLHNHPPFSTFSSSFPPFPPVCLLLFLNFYYFFLLF